MEPKIKIIAADIANAEEEVIIVPCSTRAGNVGNGVDAAIFGKFKSIKVQWENHIRTFKENRTMDFGDICVTKENGKYFYLVAVPPMNDETYYFCNLEACYEKAFKTAELMGCKSVACPLLGTGGSLKWSMGESFYSLYAVHKNFCHKFSVTLYLQNEKAVNYAKKNNWDISECFDEKPLNKRIKHLEGSGYAVNENRYLKEWYADKERIKRKSKPDSKPETATRILLALAADKQLYYINCLSDKKIIEADIAKRSGLSKNTVSYIFRGNDRLNIDKETLLSFGYAMQCSYPTICSWLKMLGLCFDGSERDRFIENAFKNRTSSDVKYLNTKLKNRSLLPLQTADLDPQRKEFARKLQDRINTVQTLSGSILRDNEIAEKSGMTANAVLEIRKAKAEFKPEKDKIISIAAALRCTTEQLEDWLKIFGMALSENKRDTLIRRAFDERCVRDAHELNALLTDNNCQHLKVTAFKPSRSKYKEVEL